MNKPAASIPPAPLWLGLSGLLPFVWGAVTAHLPALAGGVSLPERFIGTGVLIAYGTVILCFMSGVLWGFATKLDGTAALRGYAVSVLPALWAFFFVGGSVGASLAALIAGFAALLVLDLGFARVGAAPDWWMRLRVLLTSIVCLCLALGALA